MIPLSDRHALPVIAIMLLLAIPIGYHGLLRPRVDDCANPARLRERGFLPFATRDDVSRGNPPRYAGGGDQGGLLVDRPWRIRPRWKIARSYDLSRFCFTPPGFFSNFFPGLAVETLVRDVNGVEVPVHVRIDDSEGFRNFGAYLYIFGGRPVRHPLTASLNHAIQQIIGGALPLNVILVEGGSAFEDARENEEILVEWILSAWIAFDEVCGS